MSEEEILHRLEQDWRAQRERFRALLIENGRPDLLTDYDAQMRNIRLGIASAKGAWHSISPTQRRVLAQMGSGAGHLWQDPMNERSYYLRLADTAVVRVRRATVRKLAAHELLTWDGGAFSPEAKVVLTERGRFVLQHGRID